MTNDPLIAKALAQDWLIQVFRRDPETQKVFSTMIPISEALPDLRSLSKLVWWNPLSGEQAADPQPMSDLDVLCGYLNTTLASFRPQTNTP